MTKILLVILITWIALITLGLYRGDIKLVKTVQCQPLNIEYR